MSGQIRQSRISGLLENEAMHDEFEEAWTEREEARKAVHGTLAGGSAFRALRKACRKLRRLSKLQSTGTWRCTSVNSRSSSPPVT